MPRKYRTIFADRGDQIAAIIVEPIAGNMGCVLPEPGFLEALRDCCDRYGSLLIFDEVMTGFRVGPGGAQQRLGIQPDLTVLGKVIGGGLPVGAFGGRTELMDQLAPLGSVYQAGTLSGNPVTMAAGLATLELTEQEGFYEALGDCAAHLVQGLREQADTCGIPFEAVEATGMFGIFFTSGGPVRCYADVQSCQAENYRRFFPPHAETGHLSRALQLRSRISVQRAYPLKTSTEPSRLRASHSTRCVKKISDAALNTAWSTGRPDPSTAADRLAR